VGGPLLVGGLGPEPPGPSPKSGTAWQYILHFKLSLKMFCFRNGIQNRSTTINQCVSTSYFNASTQQIPQDGSCGRCISWCKLSWLPGKWPVKRCLYSGQSSRCGDDMSVPKDHFLSAFFSFLIDQSPAEFSKLLSLTISADRLQSFAQCIHSGVTMGWLLHLVTGPGAPTGKGAPTFPEFLMINLNVCVCCYWVINAKKRSLSHQLTA